MKTNEEIILAMHQALLANINTNFRMICSDWDEGSFTLRIYVDKKPTPYDFELLSEILTEFDISMPFKKYKEEIIFSTEPINKLDSLRLILFARDEKNKYLHIH